MDTLMKWAVMAQLRRGNPALPPRAKVRTAQRRLDAAFAIAKTALSGDPRDWAARQILDQSRGEDPLLRDLADRLARAIWHERPDETTAEAWFHLYTVSNPAAAHGFSPRGWEDVYPDKATRHPFWVNVTPFRRELLRLASELDESFELRGEEVIPTPCLTGRAVRLINRIARLDLPIPLYRGDEYEGCKGLIYLTLLRFYLLRGRERAAAATARRIGENLIRRSITSGQVYGPGVIRGSALAWETKPRILKFELDPRITAGADPDIADAAVNALCRAIA